MEFFFEIGPNGVCVCVDVVCLDQLLCVLRA